MSLIGQQAAVMRRKGNVKTAWTASDLVVIDHESDKNIRDMNGDYYAKPDFERRETRSPLSGKCRFIMLSFEPVDIAAAKAVVKDRVEEANKRTRQIEERNNWLAQLRPAMAHQIVSRIQTADSDTMINLLADGLSEQELRKVCQALNLQT